MSDPVRGGPPAPDAPPADEDVARAFHEAYERLAPSFGYATREASAKPWADVPEANRRLMVATVASVRALLAAGTPQPNDGLAAFFPPSPKARVSEPGPIRTEAAEVVATVRATARSLGYAVALHGSMRRDLDLIAAPWTDEAVPPEELAEAVRVAVGGYWRAAHPDPYVEIGGSEPATRAHGRLAWSIYGVLGTYLDLSVMPLLRAVVPPPPDTAAAPTTDDDVDLEAIRRRVFYDNPHHDRDPRGEPEDYAPWPQEYADRVALLAEVDRLRAPAPAPATDDAPTDTEAVERDAELLWRFWMREHRGDDLIQWFEVAVKDEWRCIAREIRARLASPRATDDAPTTEASFWTITMEGGAHGGRYRIEGRYGSNREAAHAAYEAIVRGALTREVRDA